MGAANEENVVPKSFFGERGWNTREICKCKLWGGILLLQLILCMYIIFHEKKSKSTSKFSEWYVRFYNQYFIPGVLEKEKNIA